MGLCRIPEFKDGERGYMPPHQIGLNPCEMCGWLGFVNIKRLILMAHFIVIVCCLLTLLANNRSITVTAQQQPKLQQQNNHN